MIIPIILSQQLFSPNRELDFRILSNNEGYFAYCLYYKDKEVISNSLLGLIFKNYDFSSNFELRNTEISSHSSKWSPVLGEYKEIKDEYNQMILKLFNKTFNKEMILNIKLIFYQQNQK